MRYVYLLSSRSIPKTTSGKIARSWCRRALLNHTLSILFEYDNPHAHQAASSQDRLGEAKSNGGPAISSKASGYTMVAQADDAAAPTSAIDSLPLETIRGMEHAQLAYRLQRALQHILGTATSSEGGVDEKLIDEHQALVALGVDSMALVQFKGVLEKRYGMQVHSRGLAMSLHS